MTKLEQAARQALEAYDTAQVNKFFHAMESLREALAEPADEPVAWRLAFDDGHTEITSRPVADWKRLMWESGGKKWTTEPLYTRPQPAAQWVGLTDEEVETLSKWADKQGHGPWHLEFASAIEAKLKEKNT